MELFGEQSPDHSVPPDVKYVAFLIHNPRSRRRDQPAFVEIVIPDIRCRSFICRFDLFQMFPQVATDMVNAGNAVRKDPKPRKRGKDKENLA